MQEDAVGDLESAKPCAGPESGAPRRGTAPLAQALVEIQVQGHDLAALAGHGEALLAPHAKLHVVGRQLDRLAAQARR